MIATQKTKTERKKHPGGRPSKYKPEFVQIAEELCRENGYTDKNLAAHFKVSEWTINKWKREFSQFSQSIKKGKYDFDSEVVEQALLKRAVGYRYDEIKKEPVIVNRGKVDGNDIEKDETVEEAVERSLVITKVVTKEVAPDTVACIFWLKNRRPQDWADKQEHDHNIAVRPPLTTEETIAFLKKVEESPDGIDWDSIEGRDAGSN